MLPDAKGGAISDPPEIAVACQHRQVMSNAQLSQQGINRSNRQTTPAALVPQFGRGNVIVPIGHQQRHGGKSVENLISKLWARKPLQQFLENKACRNEGLAALYGLDQRHGLARRGQCIAPERQRPNACVDKERQSRVRSTL
jgi:hypothetical protein